MIQLGHTRKAFASLGDDVTLTRWIKISHAYDKPNHGKAGPPRADMAYVQQGRTKFPSRVLRPDQMKSILVSGHSNVKIGRDVRKGKLKGYWIYTLSLEERKTCPRTCRHWVSCYGSSMPFAKRVDHTDPTFLPRLEAEIKDLCRKRYGVLIRLHALGDFYDSAYVAFWDRMLREHKNLSIFGYTAWGNKTTIGWTLHILRSEWGTRAMIRHSDAPYSTNSTIGIGTAENCPKDSFVCPEQTGRTRCCATCGLCWTTTKRVAFLEH